MDTTMTALASLGCQYLANNDIKGINSIAPGLMKAASSISEYAWEAYFGVSKESLEKIFLTYEVYHIIENSRVSMNTQDLTMRSARVEDAGIELLRETLVKLTNAGYIAYDNQEFVLVTEEYKARKAQEQLGQAEDKLTEAREELEALLEEKTTTTAAVAEQQQRIEEIRQNAREQFHKSQENAPSRATMKDVRIQEIQNEITGLEKLRQDHQSGMMNQRVQVAELINQKQALERELRSIPFFQGKKRKEVQDRILNLSIQLSRSEGFLNARNGEIAEIARQIAIKNEQIRTLQQEMHVVQNLDETAFLDVYSIEECENQIAEYQLRLQELPECIEEAQKRIDILEKQKQEKIWVPVEIDVDFDDGYPVGDDLYDEDDTEDDEYPEDVEEYIRTHYTAEQKLGAIKYYREQTGAGLAEAKEAVEAIFRQNLT